MQPKEGGIPEKGPISLYIDGVLQELNQQKVTEANVADLASRQKLDQFIQKTTPLREYLLGLAEPIKAMFSRYQVRNSLEEACDIFNAKAEDPEFAKLIFPFNNVPYSGYSVAEVVPPIYQQIVLNPQPSRAFQVGDVRVDLDTILQPENFMRFYPNLAGWCWTLSMSMEWSLYAERRRKVWVPAKSSHSGWSVGGGDRWSHQPAHWSFENFRGDVPAKVTKAISVEAVPTGEQDYKMVYSHQLWRVDLSMGEESSVVSQDWQKDLTQRREIPLSSTVGVLHKMIGDDIVRELRGDYLDWLHAFLRGEIRRSYGGSTLIYPKSS